MNARGSFHEFGRARLLPSRGRRAGAGIALLVGAVLFTAAPVGHAAPPTQEDVFKSIQDSMGKPSDSDSRPALLLLAGGALLVLVLMISNRRQRAARAPAAPLNSPGKLMKEILRDLPLKSAEMKQLKLLADAVESPAGDELNPLTLLLCPSLMAKGLQASPGKVDRKVVAQVVRKLREKAGESQA